MKLKQLIHRHTWAKISCKTITKLPNLLFLPLLVYCALRGVQISSLLSPFCKSTVERHALLSLSISLSFPHSLTFISPPPYQTSVLMRRLSYPTETVLCTGWLDRMSHRNREMASTGQCAPFCPFFDFLPPSNKIPRNQIVLYHSKTVLKNH